MKDEDDSDDKAEKVDEAAEKEMKEKMKKKLAMAVEDVLGEAKKKKEAEEKK